MVANRFDVSPPMVEDIEPGGAGVMLRLATGQTSLPVTVTGWVAFALLTCAATSGLVLFGVMRQDEGLLLVYPWLMAHGHMPYRDFWMQYPPGTFLTLAAAFKLGIPGIVAERGLSVSSRVVYSLIVNRALTGSWRRFSWLGIPTSLSLLLFAPDADIRAYPWVIGLPFLLAGLVAARKHLALSAVLFFLAGTFRFEFGAAGLVCLTTFAALSVWHKAAWRRPAATAAGLLLGLAAFFAALQAFTGSALQDIFVDPVLFISPARSLPLLPPNYGPTGVPLAILTLASPLVLAVVALALRDRYFAATNLAVLTMVQHFVSRPDWLNLRVVAATVVPWSVLTVIGVLRSMHIKACAPSRHPLLPGGAKLAAWTLGVYGLVVGAWYSFLVLGFAVLYYPLSPLAPRTLVDYSSRLVHGKGGSAIAWTRTEARDETQVIDFLSSRYTSGEKVFVMPEKARYAMYNLTTLYYLLEQEPATKYLEMDPGLETRDSIQRAIVRDLTRCTWIVVWHGGFWYEPNMSQTPGSPRLSTFVRDHYRHVLRNPTFDVLRKLPNA